MTQPAEDVTRYTLDDVRRLLTDEMETEQAEFTMYAALSGSRQLLLRFVRQTIDDSDVTTLTALCQQTTPLHQLIAAKPMTGAAVGPAMPPFDGGRSPVVNALRGVAALGLALVGADDLVADSLETFLAWLDSANICVPSVGRLPHRTWGTPRDTRLEELRTLLEGHELGLTALLWAVSFAGATPELTTGPVVEGLLDSGSSGRHVTLRSRTLAGAPAALVPDPWSMALFSADTRFAAGLRTAWALAGGKPSRVVLWSVGDAAGPRERISDISLTAAFTVLLDEIVRTRRRLTGPLTLRRIAVNTAIVGGVDSSGRMRPVSGYESKMKAAGSIDRIIVPIYDLSEAHRHATGLHAEVVGAATWHGAAVLARRTNRRVLLRVAAVATAVAVTVTLVGAVVWNGQNHLSTIHDLAGTLAQNASQMAGGDSDGLALLLAMASDDLSGSVGEPQQALNRVADGSSALVRVQHSPRGNYQDSAIEQDGAYALASTAAGAVQLFDMNTGDVEWEHDYPPGVELGPNQVYVGGLAFASGKRQAAVATSDMKITLLGPQGTKWAPSTVLTVPGGVHSGPLGFNSNAPGLIRFSPDGKSLDVLGGQGTLYQFDLTQPSQPPTHCAVPQSGAGMATAPDGVLVASETTITKIRMMDCVTSTVLQAPTGAAWQAVGAGDDGAVTGFATLGTQLLAVSPGKPEVVLSNNGPYEGVHAASGDNGLTVSASAGAGTFGWIVKDNAQQFGLHGVGTAAAAGDSVLWLHGALAEVENTNRNVTTVQAIRALDSSSVTWAGPNLLVGGYYRVEVYPNAVRGMSLDTMRWLATPTGDSITAVAGSGDGTWAATIAFDDKKNATVLDVWHLADQKKTPITGTCGGTHGSVSVAFADGRLYVAHNDGELCAYRVDGNRWVPDGDVRLPAMATSLAGRAGSGNLYAVTAKSSTDSPVVVRIRESTLTVTASAHLPDVVQRSYLTVLANGDVVAAYGNGQVVLLTADLVTRATYSGTDMAYVAAVTEVPDLNAIVVDGSQTSYLLNERTLTPQSGGEAIARPFGTAAISGDGKFLATSNSLRFTVSISSVSTPDIRERACHAVGRSLTSAEWSTYTGNVAPYDPVCPGPSPTNKQPQSRQKLPPR